MAILNPLGLGNGLIRTGVSSAPGTSLFPVASTSTSQRNHSFYVGAWQWQATPATCQHDAVGPFFPCWPHLQGVILPIALHRAHSRRSYPLIGTCTEPECQRSSMISCRASLVVFALDISQSGFCHLKVPDPRIQKLVRIAFLSRSVPTIFFFQKLASSLFGACSGSEQQLAAR